MPSRTERVPSGVQRHARSDTYGGARSSGQSRPPGRAVRGRTRSRSPSRARNSGGRAVMAHANNPGSKARCRSAPGTTCGFTHLCGRSQPGATVAISDHTARRIPAGTTSARQASGSELPIVIPGSRMREAAPSGPKDRTDIIEFCDRAESMGAGTGAVPERQAPSSCRSTVT